MSAPSPWFVSTGEPDPQAVRIFCFPHAGGATRVFTAWQGALGPGAQILAVCRPGREHRAAEPAPTLDAYIEGACAAIRTACADGGPFLLFGHSLGSLVAFEVAKRLADLPGLRHLIASGCSAPSLLPSKRVLAIAELEGRRFAEEIAFFGGLPPEVVADEDVRDLLLPGLIADFRIAVGYRYTPGPPLQVPVTLLNGRQDPHVGLEQIEAWRLETGTVPDRHWAEGGHFYFEKRPEAVTGLLRALVEAEQHVEVI